MPVTEEDPLYQNTILVDEVTSLEDKIGERVENVIPFISLTKPRTLKESTENGVGIIRSIIGNLGLDEKGKLVKGFEEKVSIASY